MIVIINCFDTAFMKMEQINLLMLNYLHYKHLFILHHQINYDKLVVLLYHSMATAYLSTNTELGLVNALYS